MWGTRRLKRGRFWVRLGGGDAGDWKKKTSLTSVSMVRVCASLKDKRQAEGQLPVMLRLCASPWLMLQSLQWISSEWSQWTFVLISQTLSQHFCVIFEIYSVSYGPVQRIVFCAFQTIVLQTLYFLESLWIPLLSIGYCDISFMYLLFLLLVLQLFTKWSTMNAILLHVC